MPELTAEQAKKKEQNSYYYQRLAAGRDAALQLSDRVATLEAKVDVLAKALGHALGAPDKERVA